MGQCLFVPYRVPPAAGTFINVRTSAVNTVQAADDDVVLMDASAGPISIDLLPAASFTRRLTVKKIDGTANPVTVVPDGAELIDGEAVIELIIPNVSIDLVSDGANLKVI